MRNNKTRKHNYRIKVEKAILDQKLITTPGLSILHVHHDDWCDFINGKGKCNCNPDIVQEIMGSKKEG